MKDKIIDFINEKYKGRFHRFSFAKQFLHKKIKNYDPSLSESENMKNNGFSKVYDCGSLKYELNEIHLNTIN